MFLLFLLVLVSQISCDQVFNQIFDVMVNTSVEPCDNFYRHACGIEAPGNLFTLAETLFKEEIYNYTVFDDTSEFLVEIINCTKNHYVQGTVSDKLRNEIERACYEKTEKIFATNFEKSFNLKLVIHCNSSVKVSSQVIDTVEKIFVDTYKKGCSSMIEARHNILWIHRNKKARTSLEHIFEITRKFYKKQVNNTPWIRRHNLTRTYVKLLDSIVFVNPTTPVEEKIYNTYTYCKNTNKEWINDSKLITILCVQNSFKNKTNFHSVIDIIKLNTYAKIRYENEEGFRNLNFGNFWYLIAAHIKSETLLMGSFGMLLGHEIAHSIIQGDKDKKEYNIYFSENASDCVRKQVRKTCSTYAENQCFTNKTTIEEDGADIVASSTALSILKDSIGNELYEISKEYGRIENNRLFFYGNVALFCLKWESTLNNYSPLTVRLNSLIVQNPEFQKAFQCSSNSKMMQSFEKKCNLFGENAPIN